MKVLTAIGFVPKTVFWLLVGATSGEVFVDAIPIRFSLDAIAVYHWHIPKWFEFFAATHPFIEICAHFLKYIYLNCCGLQLKLPQRFEF